MKYKTKPAKIHQKYTAIDYLHTAAENTNKTHIYSKSVMNITIFTELSSLPILIALYCYKTDISEREKI